MPIKLESGRLQLTDDEISLYALAATRLAKVTHEHVSLYETMTFDQFLMLYFAQCDVTGNAEFMDEIIAVIEEAIAKRRHPH